VTKRRARAIAAGIVALAVAVVLVIVIRPFGGSSSARTTGDNTATTSVQTVAQRALSSQTNVSATLGYGGSFPVVSATAGTVTWLPAVGDVVRPGERIYAVDGASTVLLAGTTPAFRTLVEGETGPDVVELNAALVSLGYANRQQLDPSSNVFTAMTATAVKTLQAHTAARPTGVLALGQVVFLPTAARITGVQAAAGAAVQAGGEVLTATSTTRQVVVNLDASEQSQVKVGDQVSISLPDNRTTPGVVSAVGTVATTPSNSGNNGNNPPPTIAVDITPTDSAATGTFDQAPVQVAITTATVSDALVVPVAALIAPAGGGYALEVIAADGTHRFEAVELGIFDDAEGLVQVTGPSVQAGQRVVVPAS
jgi:putative peptidoglycan binding protein